VQFGARPLKRSIQRYLEDELADIVLSGELHEGDTILMELNETKDGMKATVHKISDKLISDK
jgi:ATP-dependent Clp protease ATP-binding subunit ClpC